MKQFLLIHLVFLINLVSAQTVSTDLNLFEKAKFEKAVIHLNDGTSVDGIGSLKTIFTSREEVIVFKIEEKDKDETWTVKDAKGISITNDDGTIDYEYLKTSKNSFAELYEVVTEGTVKLYKKRRVVRTTSMPKTNSTSFAVGDTGRTVNVPTSTMPVMYSDSERTVYYMKKETEPYPTKVRDNYIKSIAEYMKDCDVIVEKIKNHEYNYSQLKDLVDYYNANCGND